MPAVNWEGKGLLGATSWDMSQQEGTFPLLWHTMSLTPAVSFASWDTLTGPTPRDVPLGSQMANTKGLRAALLLNGPTTACWQDTDSLAMKLRFLSSNATGFTLSGKNVKKAEDQEATKQGQLSPSWRLPTLAEGESGSRAAAEDQPVPRLDGTGESIPQPLIKATLFQSWAHCRYIAGLSKPVLPLPLT